MLSVTNFWRYPYVLEDEFTQLADSGDILLFRGKDRVCKVQRAFTGAVYDHVALLLRTSRRELLVLEAVGDKGVNTVPWTFFKTWDWHRCYSWMTYRKVYFDRDPDQLLNLQRFVSYALGKRYGLTPSKLVRDQSVSFDERGAPEDGAGEAREQDTSRTFFCSELVAACLKRCGVLAGARDSAQFWPGSFSQHCTEALPLHPKARLGEELVIVHTR